MKYRSLRFFIAINSIIGWAVIGIGGLFTLILAITALTDHRPFAFLMSLIIGGAASAIAGMSVFALGDLYQVFLDIEENTRTTARAVREAEPRDATDRRNIERAEARTGWMNEGELPPEFIYMCSGCQTFQSNVVHCPKCGTANPHHPANQAKKGPSTSEGSGETIPVANKCLRCGAPMNQTDKFCTSCGYARA